MFHNFLFVLVNLKLNYLNWSGMHHCLDPQIYKKAMNIRRLMDYVF